jgi:hypothetical protein
VCLPWPRPSDDQATGAVVANSVTSSVTHATRGSGGAWPRPILDDARELGLVLAVRTEKVAGGQTVKTFEAKIACLVEQPERGAAIGRLAIHAEHPLTARHRLLQGPGSEVVAEREGCGRRDDRDRGHRQ